MSSGQNEAVLENMLAKLIQSAILPHDCYLAGGTALYFHLHHRLSYLLEKTGHSFNDLSALVQRKYDVGEKYNYHLKTAMVYFDDAEEELEAIMLVDEAGAIRCISGKEWKEIKDFFMRLCL